MDCGVSIFGRLPEPVAARAARPAVLGGTDTHEYLAAPLVGYVRNPRSHRNKGHDAALAGRTDVLLAEPRTRSELEQALARFAEAGIGLLAISGGDGTVRDVLTRGAPLFAEGWPPIVVLPQGKTNALALDLGVKGSPGLDDALRALGRGRVAVRRPIVVRDSEGRQRDRWGFIFGAGAFNAAIEAGQVAHRFGAFQSFAIGVTAVFGMIQATFGFGRSPWRRLSRMDLVEASSGEPVPRSPAALPGSRYIAGFTTLRRFPLGMKLLAGIEERGDIGYFLVDAPRRRTLALVPAAAMGWTSPTLARHGLHRGSGESFDLALEDGFILDGEQFAAGRFRISAGPPLRFVVP